MPTISLSLIYLHYVNSFYMPTLFVGYNKLYNVRKVIIMPLKLIFMLSWLYSKSSKSYFNTQISKKNPYDLVFTSSRTWGISGNTITEFLLFNRIGSVEREQKLIEIYFLQIVFGRSGAQSIWNLQFPTITEENTISNFFSSKETY